MSLADFDEIPDHLKLRDEQVSQPATSAEAGVTASGQGCAEQVKAFVSQMLADKRDCLIRYNELDAMLKLVKRRFHDFKRNEHLNDFFRSASFTLYVLTLHLGLPDAYFFRVVGKYEVASYENTIKLLIRCKIFYEARECLFEIVKLILEREYSAALVQTEVAAIDSCDQIDEVTARHLRDSLRLLVEQSTRIAEKIEMFKATKPFDRPFIYKGDDYLNTMKEYYAMLNRVLQIHNIDLNDL